MSRTTEATSVYGGFGSQFAPRSNNNTILIQQTLNKLYDPNGLPTARGLARVPHFLLDIPGHKPRIFRLMKQ